MPLDRLADVLDACGEPKWSAGGDSADISIEKRPVTFDLLRQLAADEIFAGGMSAPGRPKVQQEFNSGQAGELAVGASLRLDLPRSIAKCIVARNLVDLLSIDAARADVPAAYFLVQVEDVGGHFCFAGGNLSASAPELVKRYHEAINFWKILEDQADHFDDATRHLLFLGIRKVEVDPRFTIDELRSGSIALSEVSSFVNDGDRKDIRKEIFRSVLSEFLQHQSADRAFSYLLRQNALFSRKLKEGLSIYLSQHSPEKLAQEAQSKYLDLSERLDRIVTGMEAKSLSIPAAVLLAVKETEFGRGFTTLNVVIGISTVLYLVAMVIFFFTQRAMLELLDTTIRRTVTELHEQGLDTSNPVIADSFLKLERRRSNTRWGSRLMLAFSIVPLLAVGYAALLAPAPKSSGYMINLSPTNGVQVIQGVNQSGSVVTNTVLLPPVVAPVVSVPSNSPAVKP